VATRANVNNLQYITINDFYLHRYYSCDQTDERRFYLPTLDNKAKWDGFEQWPPWWVIVLCWTIFVPIGYAIYHMYERSFAQEKLACIGDDKKYEHESWLAQEISFIQPVKVEEPQSTPVYSPVVTHPQSPVVRPVNRRAEIEQQISEKSAEANRLIKSLNIGASYLDGLPRRLVERPDELDFSYTVAKQKEICKGDEERLAILNQLAGVLTELKNLALSPIMVEARRVQCISSERVNRQDLEQQKERDERSGGLLSALGKGGFSNT